MGMALALGKRGSKKVPCRGSPRAQLLGRRDNVVRRLKLCDTDLGHGLAGSKKPRMAHVWLLGHPTATTTDRGGLTRSGQACVMHAR